MGSLSGMSHTSPKLRTVSLFPTPLLVIEGLLTAAEIETARTYIYGTADQQNSNSPNLRHTEILYGSLPPSFQAIEAALLPQIEAFGCILLGQQLRWSINGIWGNVGGAGASQVRHNHANSIVSGIVYLTEENQYSTTRFHRPQSDISFSFLHNNGSVVNNVFNSTTWHLETSYPGDAVLFPSFLTHQVPKVVGGDRVTIAFNAVPHELNCSGYVVRFEQRRA